MGIPTANYNRRKWYIIDCKDKQLGRLASTIVPLLTGKSKPVYHPSVDMGDYVILINSEKLKIDFEVERFHVYRPGRPGSSLKRFGKIMINNIAGEKYLQYNTTYLSTIWSPLEKLNLQNQYDILVLVKGGGLTGQTDAIRL